MSSPKMLGFMSIHYCRPTKDGPVKNECNHVLDDTTTYAILKVDDTSLRIPRLPDEGVTSFKLRIDETVKALYSAYHVGHKAAKSNIRKALGL